MLDFGIQSSTTTIAVEPESHGMLGVKIVLVLVGFLLYEVGILVTSCSRLLNYATFWLIQFLLCFYGQ